MASKNQGGGALLEQRLIGPEESYLNKWKKIFHCGTAVFVGFVAATYTVIGFGIKDDSNMGNWMPIGFGLIIANTFSAAGLMIAHDRYDKASRAANGNGPTPV